ncbi:uncharacterized protein BO95DRAFT_252841 [Aspergillus brunneoviolaceus CBS 621.78]|uniref:Uncharacterized protein n=1 Tax=Aspergillus brunneoviolaceus CBS 621.78 TaxID=1450534 RepID=A0ACD1FYE1_9EURO|nr:hypothetical protein BO95DRAFT_252841 [Aspergillus brunneoviolaceus CBS 621.78]RAH41985.1 hypothetical protein BO95DRAFT_252841 [Aspergillus brunneoviolaceus CBS 621.78]
MFLSDDSGLTIFLDYEIGLLLICIQPRVLGTPTGSVYVLFVWISVLCWQRF